MIPEKNHLFEVWFFHYLSKETTIRIKRKEERFRSKIFALCYEYPYLWIPQTSSNLPFNSWRTHACNFIKMSQQTVDRSYYKIYLPFWNLKIWLPTFLLYFYSSLSNNKSKKHQRSFLNFKLLSIIHAEKVLI